MKTFVIIVGSLILFILFIRQIRFFLRKREFKDWQIGDQVRFSKETFNYTYIVNGWSRKEIMYKAEDGNTYSTSWWYFCKNLSAERRRIYNRCKSDMGKDPSYVPYQVIDLAKSTSTRNSKYNDGKDLSLWSETECQIYLKEALANEDYEFAERIKKELIRFR